MLRTDKGLDYVVRVLHLVPAGSHFGLDLGFGEGSHNRRQDTQHASLAERG